MYLAGLDLGTTGCKISVFKESGECIDRIYNEYPVSRTRSGHEIDANDLLAGVMDVVSKAVKKYDCFGGIGVTSFGESFVMLDENDAPLHPIILYTDPRGQGECDELVEKIGFDRIVEITGVSPAAMYGLPKLMWLKNNKPELYNKAKRVLLIEDYIVYMLTKVAQIDYSLATRTLAFDIKNLCWSKEIFQVAGVDMNLFAKPVPTGTAAGNICDKVKAELGATNDILIVSISQDQVAAAIGSGVFDETAACDGAGTVECVTPVFENYDSKIMAKYGYATIPYIVPGKYVCYAFTFSGGALVKWFVDNLAGKAHNEAKEQGKRVYSILEGDWNDEPTGLLVLPHFAGAATPYMDPGSKGAIVGLTLATTLQELHLANMEGICYEMRLNRERLKETGVLVNGLRATGGGANSAVWLQMKADILNIPVTSLNVEEAGATGSAMLVGIALGVYKDLNDASSRMISDKKTYYPRPEVTAKYDVYYEKYKKLYDSVRPLV